MNEHDYTFTTESERKFALWIFAIVALIMILFPPIYSTSENGDLYSYGYYFVTELESSYRFVEWSRLGLQFAALGVFWVLHKELMSINSKKVTTSTSEEKAASYEEAKNSSWLKKLYRP